MNKEKFGSLLLLIVSIIPLSIAIVAILTGNDMLFFGGVFVTVGVMCAIPFIIVLYTWIEAYHKELKRIFSKEEQQ